MTSRNSLVIPALAITASFACALSARAQDPAPTYPLQGTVYTETNSPAAGQNAILAFRRAADGTLTPLKKSPYPTGGTGITDPTFGLAVFSNDTPVIANSGHTLLFAVNEGSNSISVFRIGPQGGLKAVAGSPFASGGYQPVSLGLVGSVLTVANKNGDPTQADAEANAQPNYTSFTVAADGVLSPAPNSTIPATGSPTQVLAIPQEAYSQFSGLGYNTGQGTYDLGFLFSTNFVGGDLYATEVSAAGLSRVNAPVTLPPDLFVGQTFQGGPAPAAPLGLQVHPLYPILYAGFVTINRVGVYVFGPTGQLFYYGSVADPAPAGCWILINKAGTRMYVANTITNQITTYDIGTNPLVPAVLGVTQLAGGGRAFEFALSTDEQYLYSISQQGDATGSLNDNALHVLKVGADGSTLTEVQTDLLPTYVPGAPAGTRWQGVVAF